MARKNKAIFLDRDGTIIKEKNYLSKIKDIAFFKTTIPALKLLQDNGFKLIIASNQSGISRGYFTEKKLKTINDWIIKKLNKAGVKITDIYYCPHLPDENCSCRKPKIKMILDAKKKYNLDLKKSFVIGDKLTDVEFGKNANIKSIILQTGHGAREIKKLKSKLKSKIAPRKIIPDYIAKNLIAASKWILKHEFKT